MGRELVSDSQPFIGGESTDFAPYISYTEQFYSHLPFYLSIGMTYEQYWNEDCCLVKYFREAYELQKKRDNERMWLQGMYVYEAICDASPVLHAFAKSGTKPLPYAEEPYAITQAEIEKRRAKREKFEFEKMAAKMNAFAIQFNARKAKGKEVGDG